MRLRTKLSIVLAMLVFTLAANVAISVWSIRFLERELSQPLHSVQSVMQRLHDMKRTGEDEIDRISASLQSSDPLASSATSVQVSEIERTIMLLLDELEALPGVMLRSGITTVDNLHERSKHINELNTRWSESAEPVDAQELIKLIDTRHELIERIEGRILEDARLASDFGESLRARMYSIILVTLIGALAISVLMVVYIRRWIISPIERLREGAQRMSMGEFGVPIEVHTNDEMGQLSGEFNRMGVLIQAMQAQKIESERLAAMGEMAQRTVHNFRTPLAGIRALSETTLEELEPGSELRDFQTRIIATVDRFEIWLQDMLRTSAPLELSIAAFDPSLLVKSVVDAHRSAAESKGQSLNLSIDSALNSVNGDAHHLGHAITAVLSNAIDFALDSSPIEIKLGQKTVNDVCYWMISVSNTGPMIPPDLHRSIFRPYFTTRQSGTGIGLALTHRVITQHQGRIEVQSPLNATEMTGCAFTIRIPVDPVV